jgi:hypothetical protein
VPDRYGHLFPESDAALRDRLDVLFRGATDSDKHGRLAHPTIRYPARPRQACGWAMLTIQGMPNRSTHMPNSSPHICFSSGTDTLPPSDSFPQ